MVQVRESAAGKSISAWIILNNKGEYCATVQTHYGNSRTQVDIWAAGMDLQQGSASGYGYDKFTAALAGLKIDNHILNNHCGQNETTKSILEAYLRKVKEAYKLGKPKAVIDGIEKHYKKQAEKIGARFANYSQFYKGDIASYNFKGNTKKTPSIWYYTDLYLGSGLKRLEMLGYKVYQAI